MDAHGIEAKERVPASRKLQREDAREILAASSRVVVAKGKKIESFDNRGSVDDEVLERFLGSTGNLRAPTARVGKTTLVGFNEEAWAETLL
jgi:arsenate reductase-like glutaredoxin family protein